MRLTGWAPACAARSRDEVVFVGAHLESWHTATGATDNAEGVAATTEAIRILTRVNARRGRTIRVALWSGEEQGRLGSYAHVAKYLDNEEQRGRISVYINDDPGTGPTYGFYMQGNEAAKRVFDRWLEPLRDLGVRRNVIEGINATDHLGFDEVGIPADSAVQPHEREPPACTGGSFLRTAISQIRRAYSFRRGAAVGPAA